LRAFTDEAIPGLAELANNKKIWDNLRDIMPCPYTVDNATFFINLTSQENPPMTFAIEYDGQLCGVIGLVAQQDIYKKTAEIGY
jgi:RimJ/RimL family protein N-acetyltransferase